MRDEEEKQQQGEDARNKEARREDAKGRNSEEGPTERQRQKHTTDEEKARVADPLLVIAYMLVYLEIAWLIIVLVRSALAL